MSKRKYYQGDTIMTIKGAAITENDLDILNEKYSSVGFTFYSVNQGEKLVMDWCVGIDPNTVFAVKCDFLSRIVK